MYAFVAATPVMSRSAFAGSAVSRAPAPVASTMTMKASKAIPFLEAPEKLDETKAGCMFVETSAPGSPCSLAPERLVRGGGGDGEGRRRTGRSRPW